MRGTVGPLSLAWLVAAGAAGGCSFFDEVGGANLSFDLPVARDFKINSTDSRWWPCPSLGVPDVVCSGAAALVSDCCQPPAPKRLLSAARPDARGGLPGVSAQL